MAAEKERVAALTERIEILKVRLRESRATVPKQYCTLVGKREQLAELTAEKLDIVSMLRKRSEEIGALWEEHEEDLSD